MREDFTSIAIVLDESGSMQSTKQDAIGGFNSFLEEQKKLPGFATLTLVKFNTGYSFVHNGMPLTTIPPLEDHDYQPGGGTALRDAIGRTIEGMGKRLDAMDENERPSKVIVVIISDGEENSSRIFSKHQINDMIELQEKVYKWQFVFIGSNQDAIASAADLSIPAAAALSMGVGGEALKMSYQSLSRSVSNYRAGVSGSMVFADEDRETQDQLGAHKPTK